MTFRAAMEPVEPAQRAEGMGNPVQVQREQASLDQSIAMRRVLEQVAEIARDLQQRAANQVRQVVEHVQRQAHTHEHRGPRMSR
jgi:hypothetical protein